MEPNYPLINLLLLLLPFGAYYIGIVIRYKLGDNSSSSLGNQFLLGVPASLVVVSPLLVTVIPNISSAPAYILTLGIVMEHGMVVNETVMSRLKDLAKTPVPIAAVPGSQTTTV